MKQWIRDFAIGLGRWFFAAYAVTVLSGLTVDLASADNVAEELLWRLFMFAMMSPVLIIIAAVPANVVLTGLQRLGVKSVLVSILVSLGAGGMVMWWIFPINPLIVIGAVAGAAGGALRDWPCRLFSRSTLVMIVLFTVLSVIGCTVVPDTNWW